MPDITFINPYVDWAMALKPASDDLHFPVFFEGVREDINAHLFHIGLCLGAVSENSSGNPPKALRVCVTNSGFHNSRDQVSGFYYLSRQDLIAVSSQARIRPYIKWVGVPVRLNQPFTQSPDQQACKGQATLAPIIGIIDEGIGYLNTRFCRQSDEVENKQHETRILALWQQSMNATQSSRDGNGPCDIGRILSRDDITAQLNAVPYKTEFEIYQENNNSLFGQNTHRSTEQNFSHGTAVLDVAAGADPVYEDVVQDILAVQLPPETLEDTSGAHLPAFLLMAAEWLLDEARTRGRPIIINVSLGFPAGTKTGGSLLERILTERVNAINADIQNSATPLAQLVFAYGNSHKDRLCAQLSLSDEKTSAGIQWVVQPNDPTPSYIEIHRTDHESLDLHSDIELTLISPQGNRFCDIPMVNASSDMNAVQDGAPHLIGRIYHDDAEGVARFIVALPPTDAHAAHGCPDASGIWKIHVQRRTSERVSIAIQVQRDDTAAGFIRGGRQSYLEDEDGYGLDPLTQNYEMPLENARLTRKGTNSALMVKGSEFIHLVGAVEPDVVGQRCAFRPTYETAESAPWSERTEGAGPDFSAMSEDGYGSVGVIASGTFSGSTVTVNGTSIAAALITRYLSGLASSDCILDTSVARSGRTGAVLRGKGGARVRHPEF